MNVSPLSHPRVENEFENGKLFWHAYPSKNMAKNKHKKEGKKEKNQNPSLFTLFYLWQKKDQFCFIKMLKKDNVVYFQPPFILKLWFRSGNLEIKYIQ